MWLPKPRPSPRKKKKSTHLSSNNLATDSWVMDCCFLSAFHLSICCPMCTFELSTILRLAFLRFTAESVVAAIIARTLEGNSLPHSAPRLVNRRHVCISGFCQKGSRVTCSDNFHLTNVLWSNGQACDRAGIWGHCWRLWDFGGTLYAALKNEYNNN